MLQRLTITFWATVFVAALATLFLGGDLWQSHNSRVLLQQQAQHQAGALALGLAQQADTALLGVDTALGEIVERVQTDGMTQLPQLRLQQVLVAQVGLLDQLNGIAIYDAAGKLLLASGPLPQLPAGEPGYIAFHRSHPQGGALVGAPLRLEGAGGALIPLSRRLNHADGSFAGVVLGTLKPAYFSEFYQKIGLGEHATVLLRDGAGTLLATLPAAAATAALPADALVGEQAVPHYPLRVTVALAPDDVLQDWWSQTLWHTLGILLLLVLIGLGGALLVREIRRRLEAENQLLGHRDGMEKQNLKLIKMATYDSLTGLANRRQFDITLHNEFSRATRSGNALAFIMIDVDCFKQYNDMYGHTVGDDCLRAVGKAIRRLAQNRPGDLAARYGGEEIGILLPNTDLHGAVTVAEKVRKAIVKLNITHRGNAAGIVTVSAGVTSFVPQRGVDLPAQLVAAADKALYAAKAGGRNRVRGVEYLRQPA